jgi:CheY-like chemotaxis protein
VPRVMIVDDDRMTVKLLQTLLELDGFETTIAPRGTDVLPLARKAPPDLFLLDYHLADMDGVEVISALRTDPSFASTPIVMVSGLDVEREALEAGASCFLFKPLEPEKLPHLFHSLIKT